MQMFPSETGCEFIHIPSLVHHGIEGKPLHLSVETHFLLDEADIQGTWSHTSPGGVRVTLVTFNEDSTITDMTYRERLVFKAPDVSLTIKSLKAEDEGDYHLNLNMEFHNKTGLVIKEERIVHVTVDGECSSLCHHDNLSRCRTASSICTTPPLSFLSPRVQPSGCEEPAARCGGRPSKRDLVLCC